VLAHETGPTEPSVDEFLDVISAKLETPNTPSKTRGNVLWALVHIVTNQSASEERLLGLIERLVSIFKRTNENPTCIIYAAWAMTGICVRRASDNAVIEVVSRPDVFLHLSGLLRAQFPRTIEKLAIFTNVVSMLAPAVDKVFRTWHCVYLSYCDLCYSIF